MYFDRLNWNLTTLALPSIILSLEKNPQKCKVLFASVLSLVSIFRPPGVCHNKRTFPHFFWEKENLSLQEGRISLLLENEKIESPIVMCDIVQ